VSDTGEFVGPRKPAGGTAPGTSLLGSQELTSSLFADASNFEVRFVESYDQVATIVGALKTLGLRVVLTSGSFDIIHEGHSMYLEAARRFGDFLIVGLDSDDKIQARKGPDRPAVPQMERLRMVTHQRGVGLVTLKDIDHHRWELIKTVGPDVLVATEETYSAAEIAELEATYCGRVEVLGRMATVSTSARLRRIQLGIPEPGAAGAGEADAVGDAGAPGGSAAGGSVTGGSVTGGSAAGGSAVAGSVAGGDLAPAGRPGN
jgi:D-glycero-beta-D-manno-heptose 1-phosphate adenylyltransferase